MNVTDDNIFFVDGNITREEVRRGLRSGVIEPVIRAYPNGESQRLKGVYVRAGLEPGVKERIIRANALRIFNHLHNESDAFMLTGPSAVHLAPVNDVLHVAVAGSNGVKTSMIGGAFVIHYSRLLKAGPLLRPAKGRCSDEAGPLSVNTLPDVAILLDSFRQSRGANGQYVLRRAGLNHQDRLFLINRLCARHGGQRELMRILDNANKALGLDPAVLGRATAFVRDHFHHMTQLNALARTDVRFGSIRIGVAEDYGQHWAWRHEKSLPLVTPMRDEKEPSGAIPVFIDCLLPERFAPAEDADRKRLHDFLFQGGRCMNSITLHNADTLPTLIEDRIEGYGLAAFERDGHFTGTVFMPEIAHSTESCPIVALEDLAREPGHPFIAGMQEKVACHLAPSGRLALANDRPFTHILKLPGATYFEVAGVSEWASLSLLQVAGVETAASALVQIDGMPPSLLVERFDIPSADDPHAYVFEDFCSLLNIPIHRRYDALDLVTIAEHIRQTSSEPARDAEQFYRQVIGSYLVGNNDAHARNYGMIRSIEASQLKTRPGLHAAQRLIAPEEIGVRLAPAYDVMCTAEMPRVNPTPSLPLAGNRIHTIEGFYKLAETLLIPKDQADSIMSEMAYAMRAAASRLHHTQPKMQEHLGRIGHRINLSISRLGIVPQASAPVRTSGRGFHA